VENSAVAEKGEAGASVAQVDSAEVEAATAAQCDGKAPLLRCKGAACSRRWASHRMYRQSPQSWEAPVVAR
jgi:hypothetical protein